MFHVVVAMVIIASVVSLIGGLLWFLLWYFKGMPIVSLLCPCFVSGFLFASLVFRYTPLGKLHFQNTTIIILTSVIIKKLRIIIFQGHFTCLRIILWRTALPLRQPCSFCLQHSYTSPKLWVVFAPCNLVDLKPSLSCSAAQRRLLCVQRKLSHLLVCVTSAGWFFQVHPA